MKPEMAGMPNAPPPAYNPNANVPAAVRLSDLDLTPLTPTAAAPFRTRARLGVAHKVCISGAHGSAVQSEQHGRRRADGRYAAYGAADGRNAG